MKIKNIPVNDRPREKLLKKSASSLSDTELLAVILGKGTKDCGVISLAEKILNIIDMEGFNIDQLINIKGIGKAKAASIIASLEFARRRLSNSKKSIISPSDVLPLLSHYADRKKEHFICISLNGAYEIISKEVISIGLINKTLVHPREVFAKPISSRASIVIIAHNHPDGDLSPSEKDKKITERIKDAGKILGIKLLDHLIFNENGYFSFREEGLI